MKLSFAVIWKVKIVKNELHYKPMEIFKQNRESTAWLLLTVNSKMYEEKMKGKIWLKNIKYK